MPEQILEWKDYLWNFSKTDISDSCSLSVNRNIPIADNGGIFQINKGNTFFKNLNLTTDLFLGNPFFCQLFFCLFQLIACLFIQQFFNMFQRRFGKRAFLSPFKITKFLLYFSKVSLK